MRFLKIFLTTAIMAICCINQVQAHALQYFDSKIDFWGGEAKSKTETVTTPIVESTDKSAFPWKAYLDPKNKEFFKEGDYTPPEPFMEIARNPTDDNIKNWFEFMKKKNELAARLESRIQEYVAKNEMPGPALQLNPKVSSHEPKREKHDQPVDSARFRIRMYFDSKCPHCRKMFQVLKRLQAEGFQVEALQVDGGPVPQDEKIVPIGKADPGELKKHGVQGVPYLLIADLKRKALLPAIEGYHDYEEVLELLRAATRV